MDREMLAAILDEELARTSPEGEYDVTLGPNELMGLGPDDVDCSTDNWSLRIEAWPDGPVWLAVDDEPEPFADPEAFRAARVAFMPARTERALAMADGRLDGALTAALARSSDPMTLDLAEALRARRAEPADDDAAPKQENGTD